MYEEKRNNLIIYLNKDMKMVSQIITIYTIILLVINNGKKSRN